MDRLALRAFRQKVPTSYDNVSESMFTFAFISAGIQEEELLAKLQALIDRALANGENYSAEDYDQFIRDAQAVIRNTCGEGDLPPELQKLIQPARLKLIYQTNVRQAHGLAQWRVGMDKWHLSHYPAWKFVRTPGAKVKRIVHQKNENAIRLKTDWHFWADRMNARSLGGFEVPHAPFGFNSYMVLRPVSKQDALRAGISPLRIARQSNMNMNRSRFRNLLDQDWQAGHTSMALPQPVKIPPTKPTAPPKTPSNPEPDNIARAGQFLCNGIYSRHLIVRLHRDTGYIASPSCNSVAVHCRHGFFDKADSMIGLDLQIADGCIHNVIEKVVAIHIEVQQLMRLAIAVAIENALESSWNLILTNSDQFLAYRINLYVAEVDIGIKYHLEVSI